jgi:hypothetical protein
MQSGNVDLTHEASSPVFLCQPLQTMAASNQVAPRQGEEDGANLELVQVLRGISVSPSISYDNSQQTEEIYLIALNPSRS